MGIDERILEPKAGVADGGALLELELPARSGRGVSSSFRNWALFIVRSALSWNAGMKWLSGRRTGIMKAVFSLQGSAYSIGTWRRRSVTCRSPARY